jgi:hypothetical protein
MGEKKNWMDTVSETIDKAAKAASEAWDGTADVRKEAWEKTKTAASSASDALDEGVEKEKRAYQGDENDSPEPDVDEPAEVGSEEPVPSSEDDSSETSPEPE